MREPIELNNDNLTKELFENVMFFAFAEGGAMGEPGGVYFYVKSGETYHFNYVFDDVELDKVILLFPTFSKCRLGMFGLNSFVPEGWNYVDLGMGNHLIISDEVFEEFAHQLNLDENPSILYGKWKLVAENVLNKR